MSARLLKRVLKEQEQEQQHHSSSINTNTNTNTTQDEEDDSSDSPSPLASSTTLINPFDLLNHDDIEHQHEHEHEHEHEHDQDKEEDNHQDDHHHFNSKTSNHNKSKKKKNKSKKNNKNILSSSSYDKSPSSQLDPNTSASSSTLPHSLLQLHPKYLNPENELRRIFGSKVVKSFEKHHHSTTSSQPQLRGRRHLNHLPRKTLLLTTPSPHWPRWDSSLSMDFLNTSHGYHYFTYLHLPSYLQAQTAFEAAKAIHDLNAIANLLLYHPYHLDSLLTMADYFKFVGDHEMSADAIAKTLYALECAWHPMFTPLQANCQLKITHETNKPIFTSLFTHLKNLHRRGCHRSSLEVCKLLLSLDSDDPMGALFFIDYLSLRAEEYRWLETFSETYKNDTSLWLFPNFSYSLSVCRFYLEREREEPSKDDNVDATRANSSDLLKQALMLHPLVLKKLVEKVPLKEQFWVNILKHSFFRLDQTGIPSLDHLINLYVERNYIIWRIPDLQKLLRDTAQSIIEILETDQNDAKDWACVRKEAFSSEKNEYAHLLVSDFSDLISSAPPEALQDFVVDPRMRDVQNIIEHVNPPNQQQATRDVANRSPLAVLFESMLPWVNYGDGRDDDDADEGEGLNNDHDR